MPCFLFDKIIFGPVISRRLGISLGINLLPTTHKICSFDCIYCECGWTVLNPDKKEQFHNHDEVINALEIKLQDIIKNNEKLDAITFAGNGEPTLHPDFEVIIKNTLQLRDKYFSNVKISVLSNATTLSKPAVVRALNAIDFPILKLDAGNDALLTLINRPIGKISVDDIVKNIIAAKIKNTVIQSMFLKGAYNNTVIDNTTDDSVNEWLSNIIKIQPRSVMLYGIARETPANNLEKISIENLEHIAQKVRKLGIKADVY